MKQPFFLSTGTWFLFLLLHSMLICAQPSNMIIFGDSLSDIGNFPEGQHLHDVVWSDITQHSYIPPSNPINNSVANGFTVLNHFYKFPFNSANQQTPSSLLSLPPIDGKARRYRSFNWLQYFHARIFANQHGHYLVPHILRGYGRDLSSPKTSISYAWWGALATVGCFDENYLLVAAECNFETVFQAQQHYRQEQDEKSTSQQVMIPGLLTQVELFIEDKQKGQVYTDEETLYIIFIGGNTIYQALAEMQKKTPAAVLNGLDLILGGTSKSVRHAIAYLRQHDEAAHNFLVFNMYDLGYLPRLQKEPLNRHIADFTVKMFNYRLNSLLTNLRAETSVNLTFFDVNSYFRALAESDYFRDSLGKQCDEHSYDSPYYQASASTANCTIDDQHGYLYWNNSHPSGVVNALIGNQLADEMLRVIARQYTF